MYYYNQFRSEDPEVEAMYNENEFRQPDMTYYCPYCQYSIEEEPFEDMYRQPQGGPPSGPPPSYTPSMQQAQVKSVPSTMAVDPGSIRPCLYRYVYIWPRRGRGYWAWLTFVGRRSASGFRWNGRRWVYFGVDLRSIESFMCV
jgi:hypothetical protein